MTIRMQPAPQEGRSIIGLALEHFDGSRVPWHQHDHAQLLYPSQGAVRVWAGGSVWLLRELLIAINDLSDRKIPGPARFAALETLILQEITSGSKVPLALPWPEHARLRRLCDDLLDSPGQPTLGWLAEKLSISERTLMRLFIKETGLTFRSWIQQLHVVCAVSLLEEGLSVARVARRLGYASPESFGNMFRRRTGIPPGKYCTA